MSDLVNALQEASGGGGSLPKPLVVNPLAAAQGAAQTANTVFGVREKQAEQAIGGIMQQATDANGNVDYAKARLLASQAGPVVQMGMQKMLMDNQTLDTNSYNLHTKRMSQANDAVGALIGRYPNGIPQDAAHAAIDQELSTGLIQPAQAEQLKKAFGPDPRQNSLVATQLYFHNMTNQQQLERIYGTRQTISTPQGTYNVTQPPPGPGQPNIEVPHGPTPGSTTPSTEPYDDQGIIPRDANGVPTRPPKGWAPTTVPVTAVPGVPPGGPPRVIPGTGTGTGTPPATGALPSGAPAPPAGTTLRGGRFVPTGAPVAPAAAPAAPAAQTPSGRPPVVTAPPQGQVTEQEASQKQFIADRTALPQRQTQEQNLSHAYEALSLVTSGRGTETASRVRNFLATVGALPAGAVNDEALYEIARKYTEKAIADAGNAGGTDTARAVASASNPNVSLINPANLAVLRNDIGKVRQQMAAYMTAPDTTIGQGYGAHSANLASNTDYRGFNWDMYSPTEQKEIEKSVGKQGTAAHDALARAIGMGRALFPQKGAVPLVPH